ncbi:MAG: aspartate aminotransferase family protein [Oscillospiraceae bacterium]|nr:aspartate aminotransferase family protein [Oscillospiraceae bacterium]
MTFEQLRGKDAAHIAGTYARQQTLIESGVGATLTDAQGKELIDFSSGIGVVSVGHANPAWVRAVTEQAAKLAHVSNLYYTRPMIELAEKLCARTGMSRVFFSNSGTEANECAIKTARKYMSDHYPNERSEILCLANSFHGRTMASLSATGQPQYHKHFGPFLTGIAFAEINDIASLRKKCTGKVGAILLECIQGEGGVIPVEPDYMAAVAALCAERDILLMVDEIQTGVGRTGKFLCIEHYGVKPDLVTLAKGLGGGLPIGAVLFGEKLAATLGPGDHGSTFGANPICCAGANAVMDMIDDALLAEVTHKGDYLREKLESIPEITEVSGKGLMLGAALADGIKNSDVTAVCLERGLLLLTAKDRLRFLPPLTITKAELDAGLDILTQVFKTFQ